MTIYLAGPMTGKPNFNYDQFEEVTKDLEAQGHDILSPHDVEQWLGIPKQEPGSQPYEWYVRNTMKMLLECQSIALLPAWWSSKGARLELKVARACAMPVFVCAERTIVDGEKNQVLWSLDDADKHDIGNLLLANDTE